MGVVPGCITEQTGLTVWNLGTVGSLSTRGHAAILELYFRRHSNSQLKLVVCVFAPPTLLRTAEEVHNSGVYNRFQEWLHGADAGQPAKATTSPKHKFEVAIASRSAFCLIPATALVRSKSIVRCSGQTTTGKFHTATIPYESDSNQARIGAIQSSRQF
ncbi:MAG: hypothetical protein JWM11_6816 [Planctomycetaceae bacterium]|nr:hypothetical protein [Planctomycetaceae bacterium]